MGRVDTLQRMAEASNAHLTLVQENVSRMEAHQVILLESLADVNGKIDVLDKDVALIKQWTEG